MSRIEVRSVRGKRVSVAAKWRLVLAYSLNGFIRRLLNEKISFCGFIGVVIRHETIR
jgi:hypothetical protein